MNPINDKVENKNGTATVQVFNHDTRMWLTVEDDDNDSEAIVILDRDEVVALVAILNKALGEVPVNSHQLASIQVPSGKTEKLYELETAARTIALLHAQQPPSFYAAAESIVKAVKEVVEG